MADVLSKEERKRCMSHIRGTNTKPEILVRQFLFRHGFRFRIYRKDLPGKPDIVLPKYKTAIFINGCFWHGHSGCKYATIPKTNYEFWLDKITGNINVINQITQNCLNSSGKLSKFGNVSLNQNFESKH